MQGHFKHRNAQQRNVIVPGSPHGLLWHRRYIQSAAQATNFQMLAYHYSVTQKHESSGPI